jgi:hypothetical protein
MSVPKIRGNIFEKILSIGKSCFKCAARRYVGKICEVYYKLENTNARRGFTHPEAVFLVMLGTSSFPAGHEVYGKTTEKFVPSWERARTQHD